MSALTMLTTARSPTNPSTMTPPRTDSMVSNGWSSWVSESCHVSDVAEDSSSAVSGHASAEPLSEPPSAPVAPTVGAEAPS
ncbi:hypothetical protein H4W32_002926 [Actinophytocola algeriensis]|uniref:Uncharacterized protein n=1 Tax=Actinophytocola algeriensis TaxID=1768010 RepID=A0A7W7VG36_9PSEU|nr:hypothetical protein [Actinophytocola algeriensis]MBE1474884.1 hypothetical protein [Actinophytocola algeriensis]